MIFNMTVGGQPLNFKVVGNPQPTSPSENTIWLNTNVPIASWYFQAEQPENMAHGDVWFNAGTSSSVEFNALKKNGIQLYTIYAKQHVNGALESKEAKIYQDGNWKSLSNAPTDGLIVEYTFDDFSGNSIKDTSPNGYNLTAENVVQVTGAFNRAASFAGNSGAVASVKVIPDGMSGFSGLTVSFWINTQMSNGYGFILSQYNNNEGFYVSLDASSGYLYATRNYKSSGAIYFDSALVADGQWHHVCFVFNYATSLVQIWVDGAKESEPWSCGKFTTSNANFTVGKHPTSSKDYFIGSLDQIRLYNRALSDNEVSTLWNGGKGC